MKNARVMIPVYFNAPLGGLQSHVRAQCTALRKSGNHAVVMCKPGPFADILRNDGVKVLTTDFQDLQISIDAALAAGPYDLIHAHPFKSRKVGLAVATTSDLPLVVTFHGNYLDGLDQWHDCADAIIAVSPIIRDRLLSKACISATKLVKIPNGVNLSVFSNKWASQNQLLDGEQQCAQNLEENRRTILFVSRLDPDKRCALDAISHCWARCIETRTFAIDWSVAGDGSERGVLEQEAAKLNEAAGRQVVRFHGWLDELELAKRCRAADLAIGPGRCAMEAMACGTPAIAVARHYYLGLVEADRFLAAVYTNFGGGEYREHGRTPDKMFDDIVSVIYDQELMQRIGETSFALIKAYFDQNVLDDQLLSLYSTLTSGGRASHRVAYAQNRPRRPARCPSMKSR